MDSMRDAALEAFVFKRFAVFLPPTALRRELLIQSGKLLRMAMKPKWHDPVYILGDGSIKKMKRRWEKQAREISQRLRKVHELTFKV